MGIVLVKWYSLEQNIYGTQIDFTVSVAIASMVLFAQFIGMLSSEDMPLNAI